MADTGYNLYVAKGSIKDVDYTTPDAQYGAVATGTLEGFGFEASSRYTTVLRPVINGLETPDISATAEFVIDGATEWVGNRPDPVIGFEGEAIAGAVIRLQWYHRVTDGATPDDFEINYGTTPAATGSSTTVTYTGSKRYTKDITLVDGTTYYFGVVARTGGVDSENRVTLAITADGTAPDAPTITASTTWQPLQ